MTTIEQILQAIAADPRSKGLSIPLESLLSGYATGDYKEVSDPSTNKPYSSEIQQDALAQARKDVENTFNAEKNYETQQTERAMRQKQADYQSQLLAQGEKFQAEKGALDQTAANQGVLFSGGRLQKQQALQDTYARNQADNLRNATEAIGGLAEDYQYKYGNQAARGLSDYYKLGGNTYNAGMSTGGVGSSGLSRVYRTRDTLGTGTTVNKYEAAARTNAFDRLKNKANKSFLTGINTKIN